MCIKFENLFVNHSGERGEERYGEQYRRKKESKGDEDLWGTFKLKISVRACDVVKDYPGYVLLDSNGVKQFGIRAKPLEPQQELIHRKIYFLIELPKFPKKKVTRRVGYFVHMSAKDGLEGLMLSRRSASDLLIMRLTSCASDSGGANFGRVQVKMRLPKAKVDKLVDESKDEAEVVEKIIDLYMQNCGEIEALPANGDTDTTLLHQICSSVESWSWWQRH